MVKRYAKWAGIEKDIHPHTLRQAKNIRLVQKALGHSSLSMTQIYTHIVDEELEEARR